MLYSNNESTYWIFDPITQEDIERKIESTSEFNICVENYNHFGCPRTVNFKQSDNSIDWLRYAEIEKKFFQDFLGQGEELDSMRQKQYENLSLSEESAFQKYSRALNEQEIASLPEGLKADKVRIVDFESIIAGFDNDDLKKFVESLQSDQEQLKEELLNWITNKKIYAKFDCIAYTPKDVIQEECKTNMWYAIEKLLNCRAGREMLILVLCIEKFGNEVLKIFISNEGPYIDNNNNVYLNFSGTPNVEAQSLYHEFNHWIHYVLGLQATSKIAGDFSTEFEKAFLKLENDDFYSSILDQNEDNEIQLCEPECFRCKDKGKALKILDINISWCNLEELWNIVGFANVKDIIYVNHLSDMDLFSGKPFWGYDCDRNELQKPKKPDPDAWKIWLKLHRLPEATEYLFVPEMTVEEYIDYVNKFFGDE